MNFNRIYPGVMRALKRVMVTVANHRRPKGADVGECIKSPLEDDAEQRDVLRGARKMAEEDRR